jgi:hypothetical protein
VGEWTTHLSLDGVRRQERLGIHGIEVVDAVEVGRVHAAGTQGPDDDVEDDRTTEASDVDRPRGCLAVVDDLRTRDAGRQIIGPVGDERFLLGRMALRLLAPRLAGSASGPEVQGLRERGGRHRVHYAMLRIL